MADKPKTIYDMGRALGRTLGLPLRDAKDRVLIGIDPAQTTYIAAESRRVEAQMAVELRDAARLERNAADATRLMLEGQRQALLQQAAFNALHGAGLGAVAQQYKPLPTIFDLEPGPHPGAGDFAEPDLSKALHTLLAAGRMARPDKPVWVHPVFVSGRPYYVLGRSIEDYELGGRLSYDLAEKMLRQDNLPTPERRRSRLTREAGYPRHVDHDEIVNLTWGSAIAGWPQEMES